MLHTKLRKYPSPRFPSLFGRYYWLCFLPKLKKMKNLFIVSVLYILKPSKVGHELRRHKTLPLPSISVCRAYRTFVCGSIFWLHVVNMHVLFALARCAWGQCWGMFWAEGCWRTWSAMPGMVWENHASLYKSLFRARYTMLISSSPLIQLHADWEDRITEWNSDSQRGQI